MIDEAINESKYWKVVNDIITPRSEAKSKIIEDDILFSIIFNFLIQQRFILKRSK